MSLPGRAKKATASRPNISPTKGPREPVRKNAHNVTDKTTAAIPSGTIERIRRCLTSRPMCSQAQEAVSTTPGIRQADRKVGLPKGNLALSVGLRP